MRYLPYQLVGQIFSINSTISTYEGSSVESQGALQPSTLRRRHLKKKKKTTLPCHASDWRDGDGDDFFASLPKSNHQREFEWTCFTKCLFLQHVTHGEFTRLGQVWPRDQFFNDMFVLNYGVCTSICSTWILSTKHNITYTYGYRTYTSVYISKNTYTYAYASNSTVYL